MLKKYIFWMIVQLTLLSCQPKKSENTTESASTSSTTTLDSVRPETISPDGTVTRLDSVGDASATSAPATSRGSGTTSWQISKNKIGPIHIGMHVDALRKAVPAEMIKEVPITREGRGTKAYEIRQSATEQPAGLLIEETCEPTCRVWRVHVQSAAYKTKEGLGIGATLGEVKKHYKLSYLGAGETEIVAVSDDAKLTFMLDVSKLPEKQVPRLNLENTPDNTPVLGMLIL